MVTQLAPSSSLCSKPSALHQHWQDVPAVWVVRWCMCKRPPCASTVHGTALEIPACTPLFFPAGPIAKMQLPDSWVEVIAGSPDDILRGLEPYLASPDLVTHVRISVSVPRSANRAWLGNLWDALTESMLCVQGSFESLPDVSQFTALQQLDLSQCSQLESLPESIGQLTALQQLNLSRCSQLESLPECIGQLTALQQLNLSRCSQLESLPESIGQLTALQQLNLSRCSQLESLPESIGQLTALQQLDLRECSQLPSLPESIGQLTRLEIFGSEGECCNVIVTPAMRRCAGPLINGILTNHPVQIRGWGWGGRARILTNGLWWCGL